MSGESSPSASSVPSSNQDTPTTTGAGQWTVSHKNHDETYVTNSLPATAERLNIYRYEEEDAKGGKRVVYGVGGFDKATGNDYCWKGYENQWKEALSPGGANTYSSAARDMLKRAARDLNIYGDKLISEKREFVTDKGETVTWWTEHSVDGHDQDTRYCYEKRRVEMIDGKDVEKVMYKNFSLSELEHQAKREMIASEVLSRIQGFGSSRSTGSHSIDTSRKNATLSSTCSNLDERTPGTDNNSKQPEQPAGDHEEMRRFRASRGDPAVRIRLGVHRTQSTSCSFGSDTDDSN